MKYWFLCDAETGNIKEAHFADIEEWTNIPAQTIVMGPYESTDNGAKDVFENPECYNALTSKLVPMPNIEAIKAAKEYAALHPPKTAEQIKMDELTAENTAATLSIIELWEMIIPLLPE